MADESPTDRPGPTLRSVLAGILGGGIVTAGGGLAAIFVSWPVAALAPVLGGGVAGYVSRCGRGAGGLVGAAMGGTLGVTMLVAYGYWLASGPPLTGGAGPAIAILTLLVLAAGGVAVAFGGLGGVVGAAVRVDHGDA